MPRDKFGLFDSYDSYDENESGITCKRCGADDLHWEEARSGRWVLMEANDSVHVCPDTGPADADEFPIE